MSTRALSRGLHALELVAECPAGCAFRTFAARLKLPNTTVARLLRGLSTLGYLRLDTHDRLYKPGERFGWLGTQEDAEQRLRRVALPALRRLRQQCGCGALLLRWTGRHMICIESQVDSGPVRFQQVGHITQDTHSAPWGPILLDAAAYRDAADPGLGRWRTRELTRLRAHGWTACRAHDRRRLAAPIIGETGVVIGMLVLVGLPGDLDPHLTALGGRLAAEARTCARPKR